MPQNVSDIPTFFSSQVSRMYGVSLRQLQWWDERRIVSPRHEGHARCYSEQESVMVGILTELRKKRVSLQATRRILRRLERDIGRFLDSFNPLQKYWVVTDPKTKSHYLSEDPHKLLQLIVDTKGPMIVVDISSIAWKIKEVEAEKRERIGKRRG